MEPLMKQHTKMPIPMFLHEPTGSGTAWLPTSSPVLRVALGIAFGTRRFHVPAFGMEQSGRFLIPSYH